MAEIILHPCHPDYCKECIFTAYGSSNGSCQSEDYIQNIYKVNCVWHYCKYKRKRHTESEADNEATQTGKPDT